MTDKLRGQLEVGHSVTGLLPSILRVQLCMLIFRMLLREANLEGRQRGSNVGVSNTNGKVGEKW